MHRCLSAKPRTPAEMVSQCKVQSLLTIGFPKAKRALAILPQLDSAVFTTSNVKLSIWGEADAPNGTVVTLVYI